MKLPQIAFPFFEQLDCGGLRRAGRVSIPPPVAAAVPAVVPRPAGGMSPLGFLAKVRHSSVPADALFILLTVASGIHRWTDIKEATGLDKWQMSRMLQLLTLRGLLERQQAAGPVGPGRCCYYHLTGDGVGVLRDLLSPEPVKLPTRALPPTAPASLKVRGTNFCFLGE